MECYLDTRHDCHWMAPLYDTNVLPDKVFQLNFSWLPISAQFQIRVTTTSIRRMIWATLRDAMFSLECASTILDFFLEALPAFLRLRRDDSNPIFLWLAVIPTFLPNRFLPLQPQPRFPCTVHVIIQKHASWEIGFMH